MALFLEKKIQLNLSVLFTFLEEMLNNLNSVTFVVLENYIRTIFPSRKIFSLFINWIMLFLLTLSLCFSLKIIR